MKLAILPDGNPLFPRYIIMNDKEEFYDGTAWTLNRKKAKRYIEGQTLADEYNRLEEEAYVHLPIREFKVNVDIKVRTDRSFTAQELAEYLKLAACILLDHAKGSGPTPNSMVQLEINWANMHEVTSKPKV